MSADHAYDLSESLTQRDRRRRYRAPVNWLVQFHWPGALEPLETETENLSSDGFYCRLKAAPAPGEIVDCTLHVPARRPQAPGGMLAVRCRVHVVRVEEPDSQGRYGIGCHIDDYRFPSVGTG